MSIFNRTKHTDGVIRLYRITDVNPSKLRAHGKSVETGRGGVVPIFLNVSPHFGVMPDVGDQCWVYEKNGGQKYYMMPYTNPRYESISSLVEDGEERKGDKPTLSPGDSFIGSKGRAVFNSSGDVWLNSESGDTQIRLNSEKESIEASGFNFDIGTTGGCIRMYSSSSVPSTYGDTFYLDKCPPGAAVGIPLTPAPATTVMTRLSIAADGSFGVKVGVPTPAGQLNISSLGFLEFSNMIGSLSVQPNGDIRLGTLVDYMEMTQSSGTKFSSTFKWAADAPEVNLNSGTNGVARLNDLTTSTLAEDEPFWKFIEALIIGLIDSPTGVLDGGATYKAGIVTALAAAGVTAVTGTHPQQLVSKITSASNSVKAGG